MYTAHCKNLTTEEFVKMVSLENPGAVMVKFTASWCAPCQMIAPYFVDRMDWIVNTLDRVSYSDGGGGGGVVGGPTANFYSVDVDENPEIWTLFSRKLKVAQGVPAVLLYTQKSPEQLRAVSVREALYPDDMVIGANMNDLERLFDQTKRICYERRHQQQQGGGRLFSN